MMDRLEAPRITDLTWMSVAAEPLDDGVRVTAWARDGAEVTMSWDETRASVMLTWDHEGVRILSLSRDHVAKVSVREDRGDVEFWVWSRYRSDGLVGHTVALVNDRVVIRDQLLYG